MAFKKKLWKDRVSEFPTRRSLTKEDGSSELVTIQREEGTISQQGDAFSAENMNDLENRIADAGVETLDTMEEIQANQLPNMAAGALAVKELNNDIMNRITIKGTPFMFDFQRGKYGYNTDPNRGADTFHPFNPLEPGEYIVKSIGKIRLSSDGNNSTIDVKSALPDWRNYSAGDFIGQLADITCFTSGYDSSQAVYISDRGSGYGLYYNSGNGIISGSLNPYFYLFSFNQHQGDGCIRLWLTVWVKLKKDL